MKAKITSHRIDNFVGLLAAKVDELTVELNYIRYDQENEVSEFGPDEFREFKRELKIAEKNLDWAWMQARKCGDNTSHRLF